MSEYLTRRGRGRPKGSPNKTSKEAKLVIADAAEQLGGTERLVNWAKEAPENERAFWATIYPKLVALTVGAEGGGNIGVVVFKGLNGDG